MIVYYIISVLGFRNFGCQDPSSTLNQGHMAPNGGYLGPCRR